MGHVRSLFLAGANARTIHEEWGALYKRLVDCSKAMGGFPDNVVPDEASIGLAVAYSDLAGVLGAAGPLASNASARRFLTNHDGSLTEREHRPYLEALDKVIGDLNTIANGRRKIVDVTALERAEKN